MKHASHASDSHGANPGTREEACGGAEREADGGGAALDYNEVLVRDPLFSNPYAPEFMRRTLGVDAHARMFGVLEGEEMREEEGYLYLR